MIASQRRVLYSLDGEAVTVWAQFSMESWEELKLQSEETITTIGGYHLLDAVNTPPPTR